MRLFTISDLHVDFAQNHSWVQRLSGLAYRADALIIAGDISHDFNELDEMLNLLSHKFKMLLFVPGNHELWTQDSSWKDSIEKFGAILAACKNKQVQTYPVKIGSKDKNPVWLVPLFSWYSQPDDGADSLYWPKPGEDFSNRMWSDQYYLRWPQTDFNPAGYFARLNAPFLNKKYDAPVISFSHFLPRRELMFKNGKIPTPKVMRKYDRNPAFNFSRVAGSTLIEHQVRQLHSAIHIYGHQHINRDRFIDGVRYIANCLGYPAERSNGQIMKVGLKMVWDTYKADEWSED